MLICLCGRRPEPGQTEQVHAASWTFGDERCGGVLLPSGPWLGRQRVFFQDSWAGGGGGGAEEGMGRAGLRMMTLTTKILQVLEVALAIQ